MQRLLAKLSKNALLHSTHAGELPVDKIFIGLKNIIHSVECGVKKIGQGYNYLYLLAAQDFNHKILTDSQIKILLKKTHHPKEKISQKKLVSTLNQYLKKNQVTIQVNLVSNLQDLVNRDPNMKLVKDKSFLKKFSSHPLVSHLIFRGKAALDDLPKIILSTDDYVTTGYTLQQEIQTLVTILLEKKFKCKRHQSPATKTSTRNCSEKIGSSLIN